MLTYITIAYLPLSFIAVRQLPILLQHSLVSNTPADTRQSIFSMGHNIVPDEAGTTIFAILIVVAVLATYCLASSLESVIKLQDSLKNRWKARQPKAPQTSTKPKNRNDTPEEGGEIKTVNNANSSSVLSGGNTPPKHPRFRGFRWRARSGSGIHSTQTTGEV
jgi:hypothetical protein